MYRSPSSSSHSISFPQEAKVSSQRNVSETRNIFIEVKLKFLTFIVVRSNTFPSIFAQIDDNLKPRARLCNTRTYIRKHTHTPHDQVQPNPDTLLHFRFLRTDRIHGHMPQTTYRHYFVRELRRVPRTVHEKLLLGNLENENRN